jgi:hypothetical protein
MSISESIDMKLTVDSKNKIKKLKMQYRTDLKDGKPIMLFGQPAKKLFLPLIFCILCFKKFLTPYNFFRGKLGRLNAIVPVMFCYV